MAAEKKVGLVCLEGHFWALNYFCHCDVFLTIKWSFWKCIWMKCKGFISTSESINCRKLPYKYIYYVQNTFWQSGSDSGWFLSIFFKNLNGTRGHPSPLHGKFHSIFFNTSLNYIACSSTKAMEWQASQVEGWTWYFSRRVIIWSTPKPSHGYNQIQIKKFKTRLQKSILDTLMVFHPQSKPQSWRGRRRKHAMLCKPWGL